MIDEVIKEGTRNEYCRCCDTDTAQSLYHKHDNHLEDGKEN